MGLKQNNGPVLAADLARAALPPGRLTREQLGTSAGATIDVGPRVAGIVEHGQHASARESSPEQFAITSSTPEASRKTELVMREVADYGQSRALPGEQVKDQAHRGLHFLVRVQHDLAGRVID